MIFQQQEANVENARRILIPHLTHMVLLRVSQDYHAQTRIRLIHLVRMTIANAII